MTNFTEFWYAKKGIFKISKTLTLSRPGIFRLLGPGVILPSPPPPLLHNSATIKFMTMPQARSDQSYYVVNGSIRHLIFNQSFKISKLSGKKLKSLQEH